MLPISIKIDPSRVNYTAMEHRIKVVTSHLPGWENSKFNIWLHSKISKVIYKSEPIDLTYILCFYYHHLKQIYSKHDKENFSLLDHSTFSQ